MWPASWKARIRCSGIARPMWMSGDVTSIPSLTRSGRPSCELLLEAPRGQDVDRVAREVFLHCRGYTTPALALLRRKRAPKRRRIRKLRLLALLLILGVLGSSAFAFGLLAAVAAKVPQLDPRKQHTQANTYVYAATATRS